MTTPGGITVEGLLELEKRGLRATIISAIGKAAEKTEVIGKQTRNALDVKLSVPLSFHASSPDVAKTIKGTS